MVPGQVIWGEAPHSQCPAASSASAYLRTSPQNRFLSFPPKSPPGQQLRRDLRGLRAFAISMGPPQGVPKIASWVRTLTVAPRPPRQRAADPPQFPAVRRPHTAGAPCASPFAGPAPASAGPAALSAGPAVDSRPRRAAGPPARPRRAQGLGPVRAGLGAGAGAGAGAGPRGRRRSSPVPGAPPSVGTGST